MIKVKSVNKYFNKGKSNEIHVLQDISYNFPEKGLVVISGESGSGKTTLLNILSGLEKATSGSIEFGTETFKTYHANKWDDIRNQKIGFIFQHYNLLDELTIYDNIEMVLKMKGILSRSEIQERIEETTKALGLFEYLDRHTSQLSGGQQQRVAIARAIVKKPDVIIADEPTGNLDSKATIEIMNIIAGIAKHKLVILVTHEDDIASFYADEIITMKDGKIVSQVKQTEKGRLDVRHNQIIYLKDYEKAEGDIGNMSIISYQQDTSDKFERIGVELIQRNDTIYVKINSNQFKNVKHIDKRSEIDLKNEHYKPLENPTLDISILEDQQHNGHKRRSVITIADAFRYAKRKVNRLTYGGKMLYAALGLVGALIAISIGLIGQIFTIDDSEFIATSRNYVNVITPGYRYEEAMVFEDFSYIRDVQLINEQIEFIIETEPYYEVQHPIRIDAHPTNILLLDEESIIYGSAPTKDYEVIVDKMIADYIIQMNGNRGITNYDDIIHSKIKIQAYGLDGDYAVDSDLTFNIIGIADDASPTIWLHEELMYSIAVNSLVDYRILGDGFDIIDGRMPRNPYELLVNEDSSLIRNGQAPSFIGLESGEYQVVGVYRYTVDNEVYKIKNIMVTTLDIMKESYFNQMDFEHNSSEFMVYVSDVDQAIMKLNERGILASSNYLDDLEDFKDYEFQNSLGLFVFALVGLASSGISIIFIMRSSLTSRIHEVSIYRALGTKKGDIRKLFIVEIIVITTLSSLIGYLFMVGLLLQAQHQVATYVEVLHYSLSTFLLGVFAIYLCNLIFGLIPIQVLLLKTPAKILKEFDI